MTLPNKSDIMEAARAAQVLAQEGGMGIDDEVLVKAAAAVLWHHRGPSLEGCEVLDARALIVKIAATFAGMREGVEPDDYREPLTPRIASVEEPDLDALEDSLGHLLRDARAGGVAGYGCVAVHTDGLLWHTWGAIGERSPLARVAIVGALYRLAHSMQGSWQDVDTTEPPRDERADASVVTLRVTPKPKNPHPDGCWSSDPSEHRDCGGDGHFECTGCTRHKEENP